MTEFVDLPGVRPAYRTWGDSAARPVVWLHGGADDGRIWTDTAAAQEPQPRQTAT